MAAGGQASFVGTHDFRRRPGGGHADAKSTVRTVYYFDVARQRGPHRAARCAPTDFSYNMVRAMTGTVLYAAEGKLTPDGISDYFGTGQPHRGGPHGPAGGTLYDQALVQ